MPARYVVLYKVGYNQAPLDGRKIAPVPCAKLHSVPHREFEHLSTGIRMAAYTIDEHSMPGLSVDPSHTLWRQSGTYVLKNKGALKSVLLAGGKRSKFNVTTLFLPGWAGPAHGTSTPSPLASGMRVSFTLCTRA